MQARHSSGPVRHVYRTWRSLPGEVRWATRQGIEWMRTTPMAPLRDWRAWKRFWRSYAAYRRMSLESPPQARVDGELLYPCLHDDQAETPVDPVYYYQDAWAFRAIVAAQPAHHVDVGSHHKFVSLLSGVLPVAFLDIRPLTLPLEGLRPLSASIRQLPFADGTIHSLSSLCVVEHIGLGRYGDPLDVHGTEKAIHELKRVLAPGGALYFSMPLDDENRIYFNAHRAFRQDYLESLLAPYQVIERRYIYGYEFRVARGTGLGVGCYLIRRPE